MKTFVITIERNEDRFQILKRRLHQLNIDFEKFMGLDGAKISDEEISQIDTSFYFNKYGKKMSKYEVCCAISHRNVYKHIIENNIERALILEDDAYLLSSTPEIIKDIENLNNYDLLYLYHGKAKKSLFYKTLSANYRLHRYLHPSSKSLRFIAYGVAYVVTRNAASKLLEVGSNKMMPPDYLIGLPQLHKLRTYGIEPNCVDHGAFKTSTFGRE